MVKKKIYGIVGETCAGKDTVCGIVSKEVGIGLVCSFTTRKMRTSDVQDVHHHFVTKSVFDKVMHDGTPVAYTKTGDIEYGITMEAMGNDRIYVINPAGIRWFRARNYEDIEIIPIYITLPLAERTIRASKRNDTLAVFKSRVEAETEDFKKFVLNNEYKYALQNYNSVDTAKLIAEIIRFEESKID